MRRRAPWLRDSGARVASFPFPVIMSISEPLPSLPDIHEFPKTKDNTDLDTTPISESNGLDQIQQWRRVVSIANNVSLKLFGWFDTLEGQVFMLSTIFKILLWPS